MSSNILGKPGMMVTFFLVLALCLFPDSVLVRFDNPVDSLLREALAIFRSSETQWMVLLCAVVYFAVFTLLRSRQTVRYSWGPATPGLWLTGTLMVATFAYAFNYSASAKSTQALTLLAGAALGQGVTAWANFNGEKRKTENGNGLAVLVISLLVVLLALASVWKTSASHIFEYRGHIRWSGPWDNPNFAGLLMGVGISLALGLGVSRWQMADGKTERGNRSWKLEVKRYAVATLCLLAAIFMARGLLHSYSRGAWLATLCGMGYLIWSWLWGPGFRTSRVSNSSTINYQPGIGSHDWLRKNWLPLAVIFVATGTLAFWRFRQTEWYPVHRAFSVVNSADYSWRNRVAAWEGALQMMADRPWFGFGWNHPEPMYENDYSSPKLGESAAMEMNDYFMLGSSIGLPALFCFGTYVWLSLSRNPVGAEVTRLKLKENQRLLTSSATFQKSEVGDRQDARPTLELDWLQTTCRAGAIVLLVGFWFDGGLFKLPTAATFWILLELGAALAWNRDAV